MKTASALGTASNSEADFDIVFSEAFEFMKRVVIAHKLGSEDHLNAFLVADIDTPIDHLAVDVVGMVEERWDQIVRELSEPQD